MDTIEGSGELRLPGTLHETVEALRARHPNGWLAKILVDTNSLGRLLYQLTNILVVDGDGSPDAGCYTFDFDDAPGDALTSGLGALASVGVTGSVTVKEGPGRTVRHVLSAGTVSSHTGQLYFPTDTDPDQPTVLLTGRAARALLALVTGDEVPGLDEAVTTLRNSLH